MPMTTVEFAKVLAAVRAAALAEEQWTRPDYSFHAQVAKDLGLPETFGTGSTAASRAEWDRFTGQVSRALAKLAETGELVRDRGSAYVLYRTPEAHQRRLAEQEAREAERTRTRERTAAVRARLARLGIDVPLSGPLQLDLDNWEKLVGLAWRS